MYRKTKGNASYNNCVRCSGTNLNPAARSSQAHPVTSCSGPSSHILFGTIQSYLVWDHPITSGSGPSSHFLFRTIHSLPVWDHPVASCSGPFSHFLCGTIPSSPFSQHSVTSCLGPSMSFPVRYRTVTSFSVQLGGL